MILEVKLVDGFKCEKTGRQFADSIICDGWHIVSEVGKTYDLLEGKSLGGRTTSDIVFIFETDENGYKCLVQYFFGADIPDALQSAVDYIKDYESGKVFDLTASLD